MEQMFLGHRRREQEEAALRAMAHCPIDVAGIRSVIAEVLATLPAGAAEIRESRGRSQPYPDRSELGRDYLRLQVVPRAAGALDITIDVDDKGAGVDVFVGDSPPIELTAPININNEPPRPFLDVINQVVTEIAGGQADVGSWPGGDFHLVDLWSEDGRKKHGTPDKEGITWAAAAPWS